MEELEERIEKLETENRESKRQLQQIDEMANATADLVESESQKRDSQSGQRTHLGGYGELHYNNLSGHGGAEDKNEIDFHRFVLFLSHSFTDRIFLFSELELEHSISGDGQSGEIELEQAYIDFKIINALNLRTGLFLLPVGFLNENHEPTAFYGVERNPVETNIIPTTWWESGIGIYGEIVPNVEYDFSLHSGLRTSADNNYSIRSGRQKSSKASAESLAATASIKWNCLPGIELGGSYQYQSDITQNEDPSAGDAGLIAVHGSWIKGPFKMKALYARWDLNGSGPKATDADIQQGYYLEPSFHVTSQLAVFTCYNWWDNQAGAGNDTAKKQWDVGFSYYPHPKIVIKADYQHQNNDNGMDQNGINIGLGYEF